mmetsp:Transcript_68633/g.210408  ORF Transcript_68633/g.210408 Transcript_68633/m.210408 type:complete len:223 (-) Transcript_68633:244-912(-)
MAGWFDAERLADDPPHGAVQRELFHRFPGEPARDPGHGRGLGIREQSHVQNRPLLPAGNKAVLIEHHRAGVGHRWPQGEPVAPSCGLLASGIARAGVHGRHHHFQRAGDPGDALLVDERHNGDAEALHRSIRAVHMVEITIDRELLQDRVRNGRDYKRAQERGSRGINNHRPRRLIACRESADQARYVAGLRHQAHAILPPSVRGRLAQAFWSHTPGPPPVS